MAKKTVIAPMQPTPMWAKVVFRVALYLSAGVNVYIASTTLISNELKVEIMLVMNAFVLPGIHMLSKMFGLVEK
jgi:hypothetical protein